MFFGDPLFDVMPKEPDMEGGKEEIVESPMINLKKRWHQEVRNKYHRRKMKNLLNEKIFFSSMRDYFENQEQRPVYNYLPKIRKKLAKHLYEEKIRTLPLLEDPELVTDLFNYKHLLDKMATLKNSIGKYYINELNEANDKAERDIKDWFKCKLLHYENDLLPVIDVAKWLIEKKKRRQMRQLQEYKVKAKKEIEELTQARLIKDIQAMEDDFRIERLVKTFESFDHKHERLELNELRHLEEYYKKFNKIQQTKLKTSLRITTLFEIEHNQQIIDYARMQFQQFTDIHAMKQLESTKIYTQIKRLAQQLADELIDKIELNRNLHERINTSKSMTKEVIVQIVNLLNYFIREKDKDIELLPHFNRKIIKEILNIAHVCIPTDISSIETEMVSCISDFERKQCLDKFITGESDLNFIINEGSDPMSEIESIMCELIRRAIPSVPSCRKKSKIISTSSKSEYDFDDEQLLLEDAVDRKREKEMFFRLVDEELEVPRGGEPIVFAKQRIKIIAEILSRYKEIMTVLFGNK